MPDFIVNDPVPKPAGAASRAIRLKRGRALLVAAVAAVMLPSSFLGAQVDLAELRARAAQGDAEAQNALANSYVSGPLSNQNPREALRLYQQAADQGLAAAQFNLGMMFEVGRGVAADAAAAFKHYRRAADQGFAPAQFNVGNMYATGNGVKQDYFEASLWFRQAADRGVAEAQYNLALAHELGRGVPKDEVTAQRWYRAAAGQRYPRAQYNLALMLEEGRGSSLDMPGAFALYRAAAAQNFAPAQNNLGILLAEGRGAPADPVEAYTWLALAVENGVNPTGRDLVRQQLSPEQLAKANAALRQRRAELGLREPAAISAVPASASSAPGVLSPPPASAPSSAPVSASVPSNGSPSPEIVALNRRVVAAESEFERLRADHVRLLETTTSLQREKATLEQRLSSGGAGTTSRGDDAERAQLQAELAEVRRTASRVALENERLKAAGSSSASGEAETVASEKARLVAANADLQQQIARLRVQVADDENARRQLEATNRSLGVKLEAVPRAATAEREAFDRLGAQFEVATRSVAELNARNESLEQDLIVAKQSTAAALAAQSAAARGTPTEALRLEMQTLQEQVRTLETQLDEDRKVSARELAAVAAQLQTARETNRSLAEANRSLVQARGLEDSSARAELAQLVAELKSAQTELRQARAEQARTSNELESRTRDLEGARVATRTAEQARDALRQQVDELTQRVEGVERRYAQSQQATAVARSDAEKVAVELADLQAKRVESERLAVQQANVIVELSAAKSEMGVERSRFNEQLAQLRQTAETARRELAELQQRQTAESARLAQGEMARQEAESRAAALSASATQLASTQRDLAASRDEIGRLTATVQTIDRDRSARIAQLQQENGAIAARLRQAQGTLDQIASAARLMNPVAGQGVLSAPTSPSSNPAPAATGAVAQPAKPATPASTSAERKVHVVVDGDSLTRISFRHYGTTTRWQEIYEANREVLKAENTLRPGQRLRIP